MANNVTRKRAANIVDLEESDAPVLNLEHGFIKSIIRNQIDRWA
jgi:hypothetical protein